MPEERRVIDATDESFAREVIEASHERPVVVDFWAPWCGPCRTLGPLLDRLAEEHAGAFGLVKINIDESPRTASSFGIRSIPFVIAFRDGEPVLEFVGAQPESAVRQFLSRVLPDAIDERAAEGDRLVASGDVAGAEASYRSALGERPGHGRAGLGLARLLAGRGDTAAALEVLERLQPRGKESQEVERLRAELRVGGSGGGDLAGLRQQLADHPNDLATRIALGRALASAHQYEDAFATFLEVVRREPEFDDAAARKAMLDLFTLLGREDPLVDRFQRELAQALYR
jgi:putative thioredoxin